MAGVTRIIRRIVITTRGFHARITGIMTRGITVRITDIMAHITDITVRITEVAGVAILITVPLMSIRRTGQR